MVRASRILAPIAQLDRVIASEAIGRWFDSSSAHQYGCCIMRQRYIIKVFRKPSFSLPEEIMYFSNRHFSADPDINNAFIFNHKNELIYILDVGYEHGVSTDTMDCYMLK